MTTIFRGDSRALTGPYTTVSRAILDDDGEIVGTERERTEYHRPDGYRRPVWVIRGERRGEDLLLVDDADARLSVLRRAQAADVSGEQVEAICEATCRRVRVVDGRLEDEQPRPKPKPVIIGEDQRKVRNLNKNE